MDKKRLLEYFAEVDAQLKAPAELMIYGSAAFILLDEEDRTSLDLDVAGPYSNLDYEEFRISSQQAGLEVNPAAIDSADHVEWIAGARLCLAPPESAGTVTLWQGRNLVVKTVSAPDLVASKLIRYDAIDQSDVRYLMGQMRLTYADVAQAVERLPAGFRNDVLVRENLRNLQDDLKLWSGEP
ncbi:MAG: hypothetical protein AB7V22_03565 [Kiritimatiellia bacterium]